RRAVLRLSLAKGSCQPGVEWPASHRSPTAPGCGGKLMAQAARVPLEGAPNPRRRLEIEVGGEIYLRLPVRTHVVTDADDVVALLARCAGPLVQPGDVVFVSEKVVAITQGRAIPIERIRVSLLAQ